MKKINSLIFVLILFSIILLTITATASQFIEELTEWALSTISYKFDQIIHLALCVLWGIASALLSLVIVVAGIKYMMSEDLDDKDNAKTRIVQGVIALIVVLLACPFVNYIVSGTDVNQFRCNCIQPPPPTTTTTTTTTTTSISITTTTTTTTTTTSTTTTTLSKASGGRFLLVGNHKWTLYSGYQPDDIYGVIFNMDGSTYKTPFKIDTNEHGPFALSVGPDRFFLAYDPHALMLDWDGKIVKSKFTTKMGYFPLKVILAGNKFYVLLSPKTGGGCVIQVYNLGGDLDSSFSVDIDKIDCFKYQVWPTYGGGFTRIPEGDMALGVGKFFIVWFDEGDSRVYGMIYDLVGNKIKDKFTIEDSVSATCITWNSKYVNPQVEAGEKYFVVMFNGKMFLYDINTGDFVLEKTAIPCVQDMTYGDGKFLAVEINDATFYDEDGNPAGTGKFGGHGDQITTLAYGNHMFVGIVAIHMGGDGVGISFLDSNGNHILDALPMLMAESPGWAAYDW